MRHYGVCASACLYGEPGTPIAYATFLAASGAWSGQHTRLLYPQLVTDDPLRTLPLQEAISTLQHALFFAVQQTLQANLALSVIPDAQWDVADVWGALAKGFVWQGSQWDQHDVSAASIFTIS